VIVPLGQPLSYLELNEVVEVGRRRVHEDSELTFISTAGERETVNMGELLRQAFRARTTQIQARRENHERDMETYTDSWRYQGVKLYAGADSFFRGFIPFDHDLTPQLLNHYTFDTSPEEMLLEDLAQRGLLQDFSDADARLIDADFRLYRNVGLATGTMAIVALPIAKARSIHRAHQEARAVQLAKLGAERERLVGASQRLAQIRAGISGFSDTGQLAMAAARRTVRVERATAFGATRLEEIAAATALWNRSTPGYYLATGIQMKNLKAIPGWLIVTFIVWGGSESITQVSAHGPDHNNWDWGQIVYNGSMMEMMTGVLLLVTGFKLNPLYKAGMTCVFIDIVSPTCQYIENALVHKKDTFVYNPSQATADKVFIAGYAQLKTSAFMGMKNRAQAYSVSRGWRYSVTHGWIPYPIIFSNEMLGTGLYPVVIAPGKEHVYSFIDPAIERDQHFSSGFFPNIVPDAVSDRLPDIFFDEYRFGEFLRAKIQSGEWEVVQFVPEGLPGEQSDAEAASEAEAEPEEE